MTTYNTDHIARAYSFNDLCLLDSVSFAINNRLQCLLSDLERTDGTLYEYLQALQAEVAGFHAAMDESMELYFQKEYSSSRSELLAS